LSRAQMVPHTKLVVRGLVRKAMSIVNEPKKIVDIAK